MIQETSVFAYEEVLPNLAPKHRQVLEVMRRGYNYTNTELSRILRWPINSVTPRVNELRKKGLLKEWGKRGCKVTGRTCLAWQINPRQSKLF
jgi:hypothetical protein